MFKTLFSDNKLAEIEFGDQEKFRSIPSLALPAVCVLDEYLTKDMRVFEWGSGASTLFFAMRCELVFSVEHSSAWFDKVGTAMRHRGLKAFGYLKEPEKGYDPIFGSQQPGYDTVNFRQYVEHINDMTGFQGVEYDVILVDGRARCACLKAAQPKLKPGGLLILDDSARSIYQYAMAKIEWPVMHLEGCIPFYKHGHTVRTTIWVKE